MDSQMTIMLIAGGLTLALGIGVVKHYAGKITTLLGTIVEALKDGRITASELEAIIEAAKNVAKKEVEEKEDGGNVQ